MFTIGVNTEPIDGNHQVYDDSFNQKLLLPLNVEIVLSIKEGYVDISFDFKYEDNMAYVKLLDWKLNEVREFLSERIYDFYRDQVGIFEFLERFGSIKENKTFILTIENEFYLRGEEDYIFLTPKGDIKKGKIYYVKSNSFFRDKKRSVLYNFRGGDVDSLITVIENETNRVFRIQEIVFLNSIICDGLFHKNLHDYSEQKKWNIECLGKVELDSWSNKYSQNIETEEQKRNRYNNQSSTNYYTLPPITYNNNFN